MRIDSLEFSDKNTDTAQEPRIVIELSFDDDNTDVVYITSHPITGLTGTVLESVLINVSGTSQKVNPDKALSTIGAISFECLDDGLTELQKTKLNQGLGLNGKRVRVYIGDADLDWSQYVVVQTQIISGSISYKDGAFRFSCSDIQRAMRKKIFIVKETSVTHSFDDKDNEIRVASTSGFYKVFQPPIADSIAPSEEVGLIKITQNDRFEIILWRDKTATAFRQCQRGMFGTQKLEYSAGSGDGLQVEEYVFLQAPVLMVAYAIMTGSWYGFPGYFLPAHWHLGMKTDYVKTSDFIAYPDLWDVNDIDAGAIATIEGERDIDGKQLMEQHLLFSVGCFSPVYSTGEIGVARLASISEKGAYDRELNADNIVSYGDLSESLKSVVNRAVIKWDYSPSREIFKRTSVLFDQGSIDRHKVSDTRVIKLKSLKGSTSSLKQLTSMFNAIRSRYSSPPYELSLVLTPDQNDLEVGDIVRVKLDELNGMDRNFEVQQVGIDWMTGRVSVKLFGSSESAGALIPDESDQVDRSFLPVGVPTENHLTHTNPEFSGIILDGDVTRITTSLVLSGADELTDSSCIYYCPGDLQIDTGVTVTIDKNVQIRVDGYFTNNGTIDGEGAGLAGGHESRAIGTNYDWDADPETRWNLTKGIGYTRSGGGIRIKRSSLKGKKYLYGNRGYGSSTVSWWGVSIPELHVTVTPTEVKGLPKTLQGVGGPCGSPVEDAYSQAGVVANHGGDGGDGGAGLCIIADGYNAGNNGLINLSGTNGSLGSEISVHGADLYSGAGAGGHTGGLLILSLDSGQYTDHPSPNNCQLNVGVSPLAPNTVQIPRWPKTEDKNKKYLSSDLGYFSANENLYKTFGKVIYLDASVNYSEVAPEIVETEPTFTLTEYTNTPPTVEGNRSSIEVSVTPPNDSNYLYSEVDYRKKGQDAWSSAAPASHESVIEVDSDGSIYEVRVRAVSQARVAAPTGETKEIATTSVSGRTDNDLALIYPFDAITGLSLQGESGAFFTTRDVSIDWDSGNSLKPYFNYYQVDVWSGGSLIRTEKSVSPFYVYAYEKNAVDYKNNNGSDGVYWDLEFRVKPVSKYFNSSGQLYSGAQAVFAASAVPLTAPVVTLSYSGSNAVLSWESQAGNFRTLTTTLEYQGSVIQETTGNTMTVPVDWIGSRTFQVKVSHLATLDSAASEVVINPSPPSSPTVTPQTIANNVLFRYQSTQGSLPVKRYEIRKGSTYNAGQSPEVKAGDSNFTVDQVTTGGTYIYWFEAVDTAGNHSAPISVSVQLTQPQNYQLLATHSSKENGWPGSKTNALVTEDDALLIPVDTSAQFGSSGTWQTEIDASQEFYMQPSTNTAQYVETFDYGAVIDSAIITANSAPIELDGDVNVSVTIEWSLDNVSFTSGTVGAIQAAATNFRYVRVTLDFTAGGGDDLAYVQDVLIKIDKQIDEDTGKFSVDSSDTGPTFVPFNKTFIDAQVPNVNASSTVAVNVIVDFNDVPNPTGFNVSVLDASNGNYVTASCSWHVYGFTSI